MSYLGEVESRLKPGDHLVSFYETKAEQAQLVFPFIKAGLAKRERCLYITDENTVSEVKAGLLMHGVNVEKHLRSGQLTIATPETTYLRDGSFKPEAMLSLWSSTVNGALREGYSGLRATGEASFMLRDPAGVENLLRYEQMLNTALRNLPVKVLCQYNVKRFLADAVIKVLKAHPRLILGLELRENRFLRALRPEG